MSLVTTCPACTTTFRITPEQLAAHRGDVRCGQCQHIFSALQQLQEIEAAAAAASLRAGEPQPAAESLPAVEESGFEQTVVLPAPPALEIEPAAPLAEPEPIATQPEPVAEIEMAQPALAEPEVGHVSEAVDFELDFSEPQQPPAEQALADPVELVEPSTTQLEPAQLETAAEPVIAPEPAGAMAAQPVAVSPVALPEFLQPPRRGLSWWVMLPLVLLLLIVAAGQVVYFQRTEITAYYPPARPLLEKACLLLRCEVGLPRHADLLNIEDSDLQDDADHPGALVLASVLYNRAPYAQAYPLLELTLTDTYDKPVLRRTFQPKDYLPAGSDLKSGISAGGEIRSSLALAVSGEKPAGYRLYVRY